MSSQSDEAKIAAVEKWFDQHGIDLLHEQSGDTWSAAMKLRDGNPVGTAPYGQGKTKVEAAEDAKAKHERSSGKS